MTDRDQLRLPLDASKLRSEAIDSGWRQLDVVDETGSTNADLLARAAAGADIEGAVLIAEHQTAGRGRLGRGWSATARAQITMSVGVRVDGVPTATWGWLSLATGLAVVDTVTPLLDGTAAQAGLKWPNDVLAGLPGSLGKLAGILAEVAMPYAVIGIGLNVTQAPDEIAGPAATSLLDLGVPAPDRNELAARLLRELAARIDEFRRAHARLSADYRARSLTIGSRVRAQLPGGREIVGIARDIDEQGRLRLQTTPDEAGKSGETVVVAAGDVVHLR
ncbi:bifunctional protein BirA [Mycobacterium liflandii 128FXT]|uniref:biotin--[biotin carboxyl-carrier protein] ligase n=1 Tax=Mycobacterium liflandii (strain 128FXT) TaxID=459424 RepID=L7V4K3_MYCL1|nr:MULTISPECIES: biotin--[acetyl-CoA-carboxylase] ligase [Mycobacterium ulcerans group]AGC61378.1 bifunctional protein BirA [Mycobacterium liflandii 128FXT]